MIGKHPIIFFLAAFLFSFQVYAAGTVGHGAHGMAAKEWSKQDDADFLYGMIAHHKGALEMSLAVNDKTDEPLVRAWANDIIAAQQSEIADMEAMVKELGLPDRGAGDAMAREMADMMANPASPDADLNFVKQMIPHHGGAILMSVPVLEGTKDMRIRDLARAIIKAQTDEIYAFRAWLDERESDSPMAR